MIRNDYILREIEQLVQFIVRLFRLDTVEMTELSGEIESVAKQFAGLNLETLKKLPADQLLDLFKLGGRPDVMKIFSAAILLAREAEARARLTGDPLDAPVQMAKALILFNECLIQPDENIRRLARPEVERFLPRLLEYRWVSTDLVRYFALIGNFARAEDALFELLHRGGGDGFEFAIAFYEGLLEKSDDALAAGNLPRDEILDSLAEIEAWAVPGA